jgi:hypothetical protein
MYFPSLEEGKSFLLLEYQTIVKKQKTSVVPNERDPYASHMSIRPIYESSSRLPWPHNGYNPCEDVYYGSQNISSSFIWLSLWHLTKNKIMTFVVM